MAHGQKTKSEPPRSNRRTHGRSVASLWSNLSSFKGKFAVLKKVLMTLLGLFGASSSNSAPLLWFSDPIVNWRPGKCAPPAPPSLRLVYTAGIVDWNKKEIQHLDQWFLTGGTRTPWGYQSPQQGVRSTNIFRHIRPENFKDVLSIVVSAVNFVRSQTLNHGLFRVFCNEV